MNTARSRRNGLRFGDFARESGLTKACVASRMRRGRLQPFFADHIPGLPKKALLYPIHSLPDSSGSAVLVQHLESELVAWEAHVQSLRERIARVKRAAEVAK